MTTATKQATDIAGCVTILAEAFGKKATAAMFEAYRLGLRGLTSEQVQAASQAALESCRFMPTPAELRQLVYGKPEDRAVKAWLCFERSVAIHGYIRSVNFDDPIINATVRALGGWEHCCGMPASEFDTFLQKRFQDTYCALSRAGVSSEQAAPLLGWSDRENAINGFKQSPPLLIETGMPQSQAPRISGKPTYIKADAMPRLELKKA